VSDDGDGTDSPPPDDEGTDATATDGGDPEEDWFERATAGEDPDVSVENAPATDAESSREVDDGDGDDRPSATDDGEDRSGSGDAPETAGPDRGGEELFDSDFGSEFGEADAPVKGPGQDAPSDFAAVGDDRVDLTAGGEFGMGGEDGGFGMGGDFDDEEFDSDIDRIDLGIEGLDEMIQGGVPRRTLMVAIGSAGTGKTTFGIQFLNEELRRDDGGNAVFITLEESQERIVNSATEKGFPFDEYVNDGRLAIVDMDPIEMANSLATIRSELPRLIGEYDAERLVLDSVSLLEMMYDSRATRRNEIYDFTKSLKEAGVTTMLTSEANASDPYTSRYGIVEYLTDAVFVLQYVRPSDFRKTRLAVEIQKIRDANHSRETKPYEITNSGISVYRQANIF